jgi:hypothetical protein
VINFFCIRSSSKKIYRKIIYFLYSNTSFLKYQKWNMKNLIPWDPISKLTMSFKLSGYQLITKINGKPFLQIFLVMFNLFRISRNFFFNRNISRAFVGKLFWALSECFRLSILWKDGERIMNCMYFSYSRFIVHELRRFSVEIKKTVKNSETWCVICMFCAFFNGFSSLTIHQLIF